MSVNQYVAIEGGSGFGNFGDESILSANLRILNKSLGKEYKFVVLSHNPKVTSKIHGVSANPNFAALAARHCKVKILEQLFTLIRRILDINVKILSLGFRLLWSAQKLKRGKPLKLLDQEETKLLKTLAGCKALLIIGGGNLNDIFPWSGLFSRGIEIIIAKIFNKPVFLGAQTIGPFERVWARKFCKKILQYPDLITTRGTSEQASEIIKEFNVHENKIKVVPDGAFGITPIKKHEAKILLQNEGIDIDRARSAGRKIVAFNVRPWWRTKHASQRLKNSFRRILKTLITQDSLVVFVPTSHSVLLNDSNAAEKLLVGLDTTNTVVLHNRYDWRQLKGMLGLMDVAIGGSYHFLVFSVSMGVPSFGLYEDKYYALKLKGLFESIGLNELAIDITKTDKHKLIQDVKKFMDNTESLRVVLPSKINKIKGYSCYAAKQLVRHLKE